jgi:hypothetical protein
MLISKASEFPAPALDDAAGRGGFRRPGFLRGRSTAPLLLTILATLFFVIRLTGYSNLMENSQRVPAYVLDVLQNGNWIVQRDGVGDIASKPPLLTWSIALLGTVFGRVTPTALFLPSAAAGLALALMISSSGAQRFGWRAGFLGGLSFLISMAGFSLLETTRYDGLLALCVSLGALAAFRAWTTGSSWTWFWLACAAGTLAKGPIAVLLAGGGMVAALWEKRSRRGNDADRSHAAAGPPGSPHVAGYEDCGITGLSVRSISVRTLKAHVPGLLLFVVITGGWFALACWQAGPAVIDKMLGRELAGHAFGSGHEWPILGFSVPARDFMIHFAPWSLVALAAFWRVWKHPAESIEVRRFERFLLCWFGAGLLLFSLAAHHRGRLLLPLLPPAALLAGRELARLTESWSRRRLFQMAAVFGGLAALGLTFYSHGFLGSSGKIRKSVGLENLSRQIELKLGTHPPVTYVDTPFALQLFNNTARPATTVERAARLLQSPAASFVSVQDYAKLRAALGLDAATLHEIGRWPETGDPEVLVLGNRSRLDRLEPVQMLAGPLRLRMTGAQLTQSRFPMRRAIELRFDRTAPRSEVEVTNESTEVQELRVRFGDSARQPDGGTTALILSPGETVTVAEPSNSPPTR